MRSLLIVDDHAVLRETLAEYFKGSIPGLEVFEAGDFAEALRVLDSGDVPDLILIDFRLPGDSGIAGIQKVVDRHPGVPVVLFSGAVTEAELEAARSVGIAGYIPKSFGARSVLDLVVKVSRDGSYFPPLSGSIARTLSQQGGKPSGSLVPTLTARQLQVLRGIVDGRTNKEIANDLGISEATVKEHVSRIFDILGVRNRAAAVASALRQAIV
jgi:DNA-binding NarL/FixJ family response regulator